MITRPARIEDYEGVVPLLQALGGINGSHRALKQRYEQIVRDEAHALFVVRHEGEYAGYAWAQDYGRHLRSGERTGRLHDLFVVEDHRQQGIGRELMQSIVRWAKDDREIQYLRWQSHQQALGFYKRLGLKGDPCPDPEHPSFEMVLKD